MAPSVLRSGRKPGQAWLPSDVLLALALTEYEAGLCDGCGQPMHLSMDPETEGKWVAPLPTRCHACTAIEHRAADYGENEAPRALRFSAALKPPRVKAASNAAAAPRPAEPHRQPSQPGPGASAPAIPATSTPR